MKLKQLLEELNQLAKERPEVLEMELVYSRDDEGNGFQKLSSIGGVGCFNDISKLVDDFISEEQYEDDREYYIEEEIEFIPNAICIN